MRSGKLGHMIAAIHNLANNFIFLHAKNTKAVSEMQNEKSAIA